MITCGSFCCEAGGCALSAASAARCALSAAALSICACRLRACSVGSNAGLAGGAAAAPPTPGARITCEPMEKFVRPDMFSWLTRCSAAASSPGREHEPKNGKIILTSTHRRDRPALTSQIKSCSLWQATCTAKKETTIQEMDTHSDHPCGRATNLRTCGAPTGCPSIPGKLPR